MDLKRKIEIVAASLDSITTHADADSVVRMAALDAVAGLISAARTAIAKEQQKDVAELTAAEG